MHSNINNTSTSSNCQPWFNGNAAIQQQQLQLQQHQQVQLPDPQQQLHHQQQNQQQHEQQHQRVSSWVAECNKNQQLLRINNNNNNNNSLCNNNHNMLQQQPQPQQQNFASQQQYNYVAATYYYEQRQQNQQQQFYVQHQQQQILLQQQTKHQQQQQHQQQQLTSSQQRQQHQLVSVDGIQSGVPTLTTSTLTPTTLQSIEETFIQLIAEPNNQPYRAGFIPPPLAPFPSINNTGSVVTPTTNYSSIPDYNDGVDSESDDSEGSWNAGQINEDNSLATTDTSSGATDSTSFQNGLSGLGNNSLATSSSSKNDFTAVNIAFAAAAATGKMNTNSTGNNKNTSNSATPRRNQGGRRPNKSANMTPEEEEKRRIRRERNKLAAARCRKRRVDQTNELLEEVAILEKKREGLQKDIESLNTTKQELEFLLEAHRPTCQKVREDLLSVSTYGGLIAPTSTTSATITGLDPTLSTTGRSHSPIDLKPVLLPDSMLDVVQVKNEPLDPSLDSSSSLDGHDHDGPPLPKRILLTSNNPMIPPPLPLPNMATLSASLAATSPSLHTPIVTTAPVSFSSFGSFNNNSATLQTLNALNKPSNGKQRPNSLPTVPRNLMQNLGLIVDGKPPTDINGVAIQTPSTGMFNFDSLMDGGTGLTPVSGPLVPTCSSQNKHPLELTTPTSEPSKLVSL